MTSIEYMHNIVFWYSVYDSLQQGVYRSLHAVRAMKAVVRMIRPMGGHIQEHSK